MRIARAQFEALLFQPVFEPIEAAFGGYGEIAAQSFTGALAEALSDGRP
jgi:hypothetical protein